MLPKNIVLLLSGGLDSTVLLHWLLSKGYTVHSILCHYGQMHEKELGYARKHCEATHTPFTVVELFRITGLFKRSALTDGKSDDVVVPNRNAVMLHISASIAMGLGFGLVGIGCNRDDWDGFADCRPAFLGHVNNTLQFAETGVTVIAPFANFTKSEIVQVGRELGVNLDDTWSCYRGGKVECGECEACSKRRKALNV